MDSRYLTYTLTTMGLTATAAGLVKLKTRLELSRAKHPSLAGHAKWSRRIAKLVPYYEYPEPRFFDVDGAPADIAAKRRAGFNRLSALYAERSPKTQALTEQAREGISDLQFTDLYRVPFQFSRTVSRHLGSGSFAASTSGVTVTDLDGNVAYDLTGSYGVNVFGNDFYKECMAEGCRAAEPLGAMLGAYHPSVARNVAAIRELSGLDEVSFHMSGTEAVMQAVRLARYHTKRRYVVRFTGAYHGWWGDVQPGVGNPIAARDTYTLAEMSEKTLRVLRSRRDIACVLVNPIQILHPNGSPPGDSALVDGATRRDASRAAYTEWLKALREVCTERGIVLIFDEIIVGFRIARAGAQEYFGVKADMVTWGKTIAGGMPVGVVAGRRDLMRRYRDDAPADVCLARGTFNSHPYVMASMDAFFTRFDKPEMRALYDGIDERWNARARAFNQRLKAEGIPLEVANLGSIWAVCHTIKSRYHWMLQFYLRSEGLALAWTGSGRLIFSLNYTDADFAAVTDRFVAACKAMQADGWWWQNPDPAAPPIKRQVLREMLRKKLGLAV
ncbi:MAG: aminotransferase class III-fold pyridoxal phosphate-dependent enzyme [Hyphomicrobiales bacterium]|nr:MAG: aminotransferase class III-fold pyridoxal phosphate-dependent enzyme [Hyphomicrobiales bacterium]